MKKFVNDDACWTCLMQRIEAQVAIRLPVVQGSKLAAETAHILLMRLAHVSKKARVKRCGTHHVRAV